MNWIRRKNTLILLIAVVASIFGTTLASPMPVQAQYCAASGSCPKGGTILSCIGGSNAGEDCEDISDCPGSDCRPFAFCSTVFAVSACTGKAYPSCAGSCPQGYCNTGSCYNVPPPATPRPPTPPPVTRYGCSGTSCVVQSGGPYTVYSTCRDACKPGGPPPPPPPPIMYSCSGPGGQCAPDPGGTHPTNDCDRACAPQPTPTDPPVCQPEHKAKPATIWVRVVSKSPSTGQTVAWKGGETNSPIYTAAGWSVAAPSTDASGNKYFTTYNSYANGSPKTFDLAKNKISNDMNVRVSVANPGSHDTIEDACKTSRTVYIPEDWIAHGGMWSNHFCSGGQAYSASGNYPAKSNNYCASNIGGPVYWNHDTSGEHGTLDCDDDPRIWAAKDRDGCSEGFMQYAAGNIPNEDGVFASMHDQLVPLLQFAATDFAEPRTLPERDLSWIDTSYDGYWSYQYKAWDEWDSFDGIHTKVTITPPPGQNCLSAHWFSNSGSVKRESPISQNLGSGECTITFNPKAGGNFLVVELTEEPEVESCTIQLSKLSNPEDRKNILEAEYGEAVQAFMVGNTNDKIAGQRFNIWLEKINTDSESTIVQTPFPQLSNVFGTSARTYELFSGGNYYYRYISPTPCDPTNANSVCQDVASFNSSDPPNGIAPLAKGTYAVHCDNSVGDLKCSGNPICPANGGPNASCSTPDCLPDPTPPLTFSAYPTDHAILQISCTENCNACSNGTEVNNCSTTTPKGFCPVGAQATAPNRPTITAPATTQIITGTVFPISWNPPADTTNLDTYQYIVFKKNSFDNDPDAAIAANTAYYAANYVQHPDIKKLAYTNDTSFTEGTPTSTFGRDMVVAVRTMNSPGACTLNQPLYSQWSITFSSLVGNVSGNIYNDEADDGPPGSTLATNFYQGIVTIAPDVFGGFPTTFNNTNTYTVPNVPYSPSSWGVPMIRRLQIINNPLDLANTHVCSKYSSNTGNFICELSGTFSPQTGADFYVKRYNFAFSSWWQAWGGSVYSKNAMKSSIPDDNLVCNPSEQCYPHIVAADHNNASVTNKSAGLPISNQADITTNGNRFSENDPSPPTATNPRAPGQQAALLENYAYFSSGTDIGIPAALGAGDTSQSGLEFMNTAASGTEIEGARVTTYPGNLTLNLSATEKITVPDDQKWVIFVSGNLRINGPSGHDDASQTGLIKVNNGEFLSFIVGGDITFDWRIGYEENAGDRTIAAKVTPNIEGVYIADRTLKIESRDENSSTPDDYKFVGAGTFVGWGGVLIPRKFDDDMLYRRELNITSPVDLFIHRPDFVTNSPEFMRNKPQLTWQEVK